MKLTTLAAASVLAAAAGTLAAQQSGVSHPEELNDTITASSATPATGDHYHKPSPAVAAEPAAAAIVTAPASAPVVASAPATVATPMQTVAPGHMLAQMDPDGFVVSDDPTSGIVKARPTRSNELAEGTLIHAALDDTLSTVDAQRGRIFTAHLSSDVMNNGRVLLPAGSVIRGRVTEVREARRFHAPAMMRLQPDTVTLPDGTQYPLAAQIIDFDRMSDAKRDVRVNNEGEIISNGHTQRKLAGVSLTTGSAAVAGAVIAGAPGALVGAGIGAGAGVIWWNKQDHNQTLAQGTVMILNLDRPLFVGTDTTVATPSAE